jgi:hypothetical protein
MPEDQKLSMSAKPEALPKPTGKPATVQEFSDEDLELFKKQNGLWLL